MTSGACHCPTLEQQCSTLERANLMNESTVSRQGRCLSVLKWKKLVLAWRKYVLQIKKVKMRLSWFHLNGRKFVLKRLLVYSCVLKAQTWPRIEVFHFLWTLWAHVECLFLLVYLHLNQVDSWFPFPVVKRIRTWLPYWNIWVSYSTQRHPEILKFPPNCSIEKLKPGWTVIQNIESKTGGDWGIWGWRRWTLKDMRYKMCSNRLTIISTCPWTF